MPEIIRYIPEDVVKEFAKDKIFGEIASDGKTLREILNQYLTAPNLFGKSLRNMNRFSHWDIYLFCIHTGIIPDRFKLENAIHPGPGEMSSEERWLLENFFMQRRDEIIPKILGEVRDEDVYETR